MAIDGGERTCGVHELICIRKVSPEAIGFLSTVGVSIVLLLFLLLYINKKMCSGKDGGFHCARHPQDPDLHGSSSESEDEALGKYHEAMTRLHGIRPGPDKQQNYMWETRQKYSPLSAEYDGYSSEVSADEGKEHMTAGTGENADEGDIDNVQDTAETEPEKGEEDNADKSAAPETGNGDNNKTSTGKKDKSGTGQRKEKRKTKSPKKAKDKPKKKERFYARLKTKNPLKPK